MLYFANFEEWSGNTTCAQPGGVDVHRPQRTTFSEMRWIGYKDGEFILEDHSSKFGTLVVIKKPRPVDVQFLALTR